MLAPAAADVDVPAALAHFREHGWARLGVVASDAGLERLRARADAVMLAPTPAGGLFYQRDAQTGRYEDLVFGRGWEGPSLDYRKIEKLEIEPAYRAWLENDLFARIATAYLGDEVAIYRATLFTKSARGGTVLPWHQDGGNFWGLDRDPELQIWTALDDAPVEAGCVEVVDASHLGGLVTPLGGTIQKHLAAAARAEERTLALPARAGEVILIHNCLWHRSGNNTTGRARRAFTVSYITAATRCTRTRRAPRTFMRVFGGARLR